jgi:hypothetical protein
MTPHSESYLTGCVIGTPERACLGVDVGDAPGGAPGGECGRVYPGADDLVPLAFEAALLLFGTGEPCGIGRGQAVTIRHDRTGGCIVGLAVPGHADGLNPWSGGCSRG